MRGWATNGTPQQRTCPEESRRPQMRPRSIAASAVLKPRGVALVRHNHTGPPLTAQPPVKPNTLTIASLLSIILVPFHVGGDIALGLDKGGSGLVFALLPILLVLACGTFLLAERISGHVIMLLGGLAALAMPIIHRNNAFTPTIAKAPGGIFFIWTLMALGVTGGLAILLSAGGLWNLRTRKT
jgi:hypothetical protein